MQAVFLDKGGFGVYYIYIKRFHIREGVTVRIFLLLVFCIAFVFLLVRSIVLAMADFKDGFVMRWNTFLYLVLASACLCGMMVCMVYLH